MVGVAQLVRAPGCGPGGRGFKSHHSPKFSGYSVVRLTRLLWEQEIGSSNLSTPTLEEPISSSKKPFQTMRLLFFIYNYIHSSIPKSRTRFRQVILLILKDGTNQGMLHTKKDLL